jgi:DNA-binding transcriptional ArsR family regulator
MAGVGVFWALGNDTRRALLDLVRDQPQSVNELAARFPMERASISEHLKVLRDAGLVTVRQDGRHRYYRAQPERLREVAEWLAPYELFWRDRIGRLREFLADDQP